MKFTELKSVEFWIRFIRLPFVVGLAVAGYLTLVMASKGTAHTFLLAMLIPFLVATVLLECMQAIGALRKAKKSQ